MKILNMIALRGRIKYCSKSIVRNEAFRCVPSYPVNIETKILSHMNILGSLKREMKKKI